MSWRYALLTDRYSSSIGDRYSPHYYQSPSRLENSEQTTGRQLQRVLHYSMAPCRTLPGLRRSECAIHDVDCDEVYPGIYIGDAAAAKNKTYLRLMGITHVLNAAEGCRYGQVDTGHSYYRDMPSIRRKHKECPFRYMGFPMIDAPTTDISRYFYVAAKFIDSAISSGGKILVHCLVGMSRSATCVLAYLMICRKMSAVDAIRTVRMRREIRPNDGFLQQLADLDMELKRKNLYPY
ncbi:dual specificity protein phosphatase 3 isoform X1 [Scaptodrosophila lebanonensis]|uniref:Dual specificity protein phosphatase n=1 Tax=Drosophila lebanonensis TaxID=7225 RepID=A0A6J2UDY2_DROLE|nr:dual specificity protein phosphatase 3 isoform X1 [Scaptodrosophila lebanonensis]XP_030386575.1 dual specificity protein phosphatase 3 isoform X1 [Scaptodrosophila lebanonensis]